MSEFNDQSPTARLPEHEPIGPMGAPAQPQVALAWLVIIGVVALVMMMPLFASPEKNREVIARRGVLTLNLQLRYHIGAYDLLGSLGGGADQIGRQLRATARTGSVYQRLAAIAAVGEILGPDEAADALAHVISEIELHQHDLQPHEAQALDVFKHLFAAPLSVEGDPLELTEEERLRRIAQLSAGDRQFLDDDFGWIGRLALLPAGTDDRAARRDLLSAAHWTMGLIATVAFAGFTLVVIGIGALIFMAVGAARTRRFSRLSPAQSGYGFYVETFAVWLVLFFGLQMLLGRLLPGGVALSFFVSLIALGWPAMRGMDWSQVREDLGLHRGRGWVAETFAGVGGYVMMLPFMIFGFLLSLTLMAIAGMFSPPAEPFETVAVPAHPIIDHAAEATLMTALGILLVGAVAAPIVEEIFFRGALYRYLRSAFDHTGIVASVILSGVFNAILFAAVHPQGVLAIPALASIGFALSLIREWRGSVWPCIVTHAISNGIVLSLMLVLFSFE